jgi:hypothetical protein
MCDEYSVENLYDPSDEICVLVYDMQTTYVEYVQTQEIRVLSLDISGLNMCL